MVELVCPSITEALLAVLSNIADELLEAPAKLGVGILVDTGTLEAPAETDTGTEVDSALLEEGSPEGNPGGAVHVPSVPHVSPTFGQHAVIGVVQVAAPIGHTPSQARIVLPSVVIYSQGDPFGQHPFPSGQIVAVACSQAWDA